MLQHEWVFVESFVFLSVFQWVKGGTGNQWAKGANGPNPNIHLYPLSPFILSPLLLLQRFYTFHGVLDCRQTIRLCTGSTHL